MPQVRNAQNLMLREQAKDLFDRHNRYPGPALENHNLRIAAFTLGLGKIRGVHLHSDFIHAGCYLHDIGLLVEVPGEQNYLKRSWLFVKHRANSWGLSEDQMIDLEEILLYNHALRRLPGLGAVGDLVRRAVQVEHSLGRISHGLDRDTIRSVFAEHPRLNLTSILLDFARITIFEDGARQLLPIFFPRKSS